MKTKTKTFQEGDEITLAMMFASDYLWGKCVRGEGEMDNEIYYLTKKVQITIIIFDE